MTTSGQAHDVHCVPRGFRLAAVHCGIKGEPDREDLTLCVAEKAAAAGVYTQNRVVAPAVSLNRQRTPSDDIARWS